MVRVNLIPESTRLAQAQRRHVRCWSVSIALAVGAVMVCLGIEWLHQVEAAKLHAQNEELQLKVTAARAELRSVTAEADRMLLQIERAKALKSKRAWSGMLAMITSCISPGCWLTSIATDPAKPPAGSIRSRAPEKKDADEAQRAVIIDAPRKLRITGYAPEAAQPHEVVTNLKNTEVFKRVVLERSQREPILDGSYFRFEVVCEW